VVICHQGSLEPGQRIEFIIREGKSLT